MQGSAEGRTESAATPGVGLDHVAEPKVPLVRSRLASRRVPGQQPVPAELLGDLRERGAVPRRAARVP
jgi:hypothetical protein